MREREREEKNIRESLRRKKRRGEESSTEGVHLSSRQRFFVARERVARLVTKISIARERQVVHLITQNFCRERERRKMLETVKVEEKEKEGEMCIR